MYEFADFWTIISQVMPHAKLLYDIREAQRIIYDSVQK